MGCSCNNGGGRIELFYIKDPKDVAASNHQTPRSVSSSDERQPAMFITYHRKTLRRKKLIYSPNLFLIHSAAVSCSAIVLIKI